LYAADWRADLEEPPKKKPKTSTFANFYAQLKKSYRTDDESAYAYNEGDFDKQSDCREESLKRVKTLSKIIEKHNVLSMKLYIFLGKEFAYLKFVKFSKRCVAHVANNDIFTVITCLDCCNKNKPKISNFYKEDIGYSKTHINFLINIAKLSEMYPKFKFTQMSLDKLKSNMKTLLAAMKEDDYWNYN
jgi:hypothetical protein